MKTIWKYNLKFENIIELQMPKGAEILTVQQDKKTNRPCLWAMVDSDAEKESRFIELFGTGEKIPTDMGVDRIYIGTYQYQNGAFVGHVFERL